MGETAEETLARARAICLALPEATEKEAWGMPTFRVRGKLFAHFADDHHGDGRVALWLKAEPGVRDLLVEAAPERFFVPAYVGPRGWMGVRVDGEVDWEEVAEFVEDAWMQIAPKRLAAAFAERRD